MCTVSYIPLESGFVLTSNRDENPFRDTLEPFEYQLNDKIVTFPKDKIAGGTWIAHDQKGRTACLLNGGFIKHKRKTAYKRSRGFVVLDVYNYDTNLEFIMCVNLNGFEPFTFVLVEPGIRMQLISFVWDGKRKYARLLNSDQPYLWSSSTLYNQDVHDDRVKAFMKWIEVNSQITPHSILDYHKDNYNIKIGELIGNEGVETVSITQITRIHEITKTVYH
ncbi:MAG: NRDE family protein [Bacteroidetes bacterium]|nr:NRDE family protein [Bacteroidota bacterium]